MILDREKIIKWINHNRFTVIVPVLLGILWIFAIGCSAETISPLTGEMVNAKELAVDYDSTIAKFKLAGDDLEEQVKMQGEIKKLILTLATGNVADLPGLIQMLLGGGLIGFIGDNIRKGGVIGGLKRNK